MARAVRNKMLTHERNFYEVKRLSSVGLWGTHLPCSAAEGLSWVVPFGSRCVATHRPASNLPTHLSNCESAGVEGHAEAYGDVTACASLPPKKQHGSGS